MLCNWKHGKDQYGNMAIYGYEKINKDKSYIVMYYFRNEKRNCK